MEIRAQELTAAAFAPFGEVVAAPARRPDADGPGWRWWAETALLPASARPFGVGYLRLEPPELRFDWAERHMRTVEMLIPAGGDCLVYVGPADHPEEPAQRPDLERFQVFRIREGQAVILRPGVWHGAPLAADGALAVFVLLLEGTGREDTIVVRFEETPVSIAR